MLHVTNGQCAAAIIRGMGVDGDVLCWDDVLHEGPVPRVPGRELREVRATFLAGSTTFEQVLADLTARDERLARAAGAHEAIVLWFEHDLYDQLQLLQILDLLAEERAGWERVTLVCGDEYLGLSTPDRLRERFPRRVGVSHDAVDLARARGTPFARPTPPRSSRCSTRAAGASNGCRSSRRRFAGTWNSFRPR